MRNPVMAAMMLVATEREMIGFMGSVSSQEETAVNPVVAATAMP